LPKDLVAARTVISFDSSVTRIGRFKEIVTCLELCQRLYSALSVQPIAVLIDEGNQISRMTHVLMRGSAAPTVRPVRLNLITPTHDSELKTQD